MLTNVLPQPQDEGKKHQVEFYAICLGFFIIGMSFSTWASRVPDVRDAAFLTAATLGYVLLMRGVGNIVMMPILTVAIGKFGARNLALFMGGIVSLILIPIAFIHHWVGLALMLFMVGFFSSGYNISINALGAKLEADTGRSHMSKIHSWFGVGNLTGALLGTAATSIGISTQVHFIGASVLMITILILISGYLPKDAPHPDAPRQKFVWPHGGLIALGIIVFLASSIEASIMNWVGLFFTDYIKAVDGFAPIGYAMYAGSMLLMRVFGDHLKSRYGAKHVLIVGNVVAASGIFISVFIPNIYTGAFGLFLTGAGIALNFPLVFSAAGREGAIALTSVATFGYFGAMLSQPVMGAITTEFQLSGAFIFLALSSVAVSVLSWRSGMLK